MKGKNSEEKKIEERIIPIDITSEMEDSYLDYAMSVITSRALPDARDGLKPVQRRILYSMYGMGLTASSKFRKSAAVVGDVLGKYHPHGDSSVYEAMVKMAQPFSYRYPLVMGQGNFGSTDGDAAAAMRYTEAKMSRLSSEILRDLEKDTVDWRPNYDETRLEPVVFPSAVPSLLLNGTLGIAVGMATNIPPHNLREIIDACVYLVDNEDARTDDLLKFVKGPDFPTYGIVFGESDLRQAYASGRGGVVTRGEAEIIEGKTRHQIVITSIPYRVNKANLVMKIADLVHEKKIDGIKTLRDESTRDTRIVIDLKNGAYPQKVLNFIYKHTDLETTFHFNIVALLDGIPQTLSLKSLLAEFITHRKVVVIRRAKYDLKKAEDRAHILEGLKRALDHIDQVIKIIKGSKDTPSARVNLIKEFKFSERQAVAILEMRLQKLAGLERKAIEEELKEKIALIKSLKELLASPKKILAVVKSELVEIREKYGDDRRTKVVKHVVGSISIEDMIPNEDSVLVFTSGGYIKRTNPDEYKKQKRGGVGVVDINTKEEDFISHFLTATTHSDLLFFTDKGKVYQIKMYDIPEGGRATRGKSIMNFISLAANEKVTSILAMPKEIKKQEGLSLFMVTKKGVGKKVAAKNLRDVRRNGLIAIKLSAGDELLAARFVEKEDDIILATAKGQAIRFKESDVRRMGRGAGGVRVMRIPTDDTIVGAGVICKEHKTPQFVVISSCGYGKKTDASEYKTQKRGGSGVKTIKTTQKTGNLIAATVVTEETDEFVVISKKSQVIRVDIKGVPKLGRQTQGVRMMKIRPGDSVASLLVF